jgi:hypothetical protein
MRKRIIALLVFMAFACVVTVVVMDAMRWGM